MGDRANFAIRRNGTTDVFYGQFGANTALADTFWGPESAESVFRAQAPTEEWLDDVNCEAAIGACFDTRTLAFHDSHHADDVLELAARLMATVTWRGWTVERRDYASSVALAVGQDIREMDAPSSDFAPGLGTLDVSSDPNVRMEGIVEIVRNGRSEQRLASTALSLVLWHGPDHLLRIFDKMVAVDAARRANEGHFFFGRPSTLLARSAPGIATIDIDHKTVDVTFLRSADSAQRYAQVGRAAQAWPGWTVRRDIGSVAAHAARTGHALPPELEFRPPPRPALDVITVLAVAVFRAEARKESIVEFAMNGLGRFTGDLGPHPLSLGARIARFSEMVDTLRLDDVARASVIAAARKAAQPPVTPDVRPAPLAFGTWGDYQVIVERDGDRLWGLALPDDGPPTVLAWASRSAKPKAICALGKDARHRSPTHFELHAARSTATAAVTKSGETMIFAIDLARGTATPLATLASPIRLERMVCSPAGDAFAVQVTDAAFRHHVLVYQQGEGWIGEQACVALEEWTDSGLRVMHGEVSNGAFTAVIRPFARTADGSAVRARLETVNAAEQADSENDDDNDAWQAPIDRDPQAALVEIRRALDDRPYAYHLARAHAVALVRLGRFDEACAAVEYARLIDPDKLQRLADDERFEPLRGNDAFRLFDYQRLIGEAGNSEDLDTTSAALYRAIELMPERIDAWAALVDCDLPDHERIALSDRWRASRPDELAAWVAHTTVRLDAGDYESADRSAGELVARWPDRYEGYFAYAQIAARERGDADIVRGCLDRADEAAAALGHEARSELMRAVHRDRTIQETLDDATDDSDAD